MYRPTDLDVELDEEAFRLLRDLIHERFGLYFEENQRASLRSRLRNRLASRGLRSFEDYYHELRFGPDRAEELQSMVSHLTNNETYFYRELPQLKVFADHVLPQIKERKARAGERTLRVLLRGLLHGRGGVHAGDDRLRQRPLLLELGRRGHGARRGRRRRSRRRGRASTSTTPSAAWHPS